jgi:hypothetical protein
MRFIAADRRNVGGRLSRELFSDALDHFLFMIKRIKTHPVADPDRQMVFDLFQMQPGTAEIVDTTNLNGLAFLIGRPGTVGRLGQNPTWLEPSKRQGDIRSKPCGRIGGNLTASEVIAASRYGKPRFTSKWIASVLTVIRAELSCRELLVSIPSSCWVDHFGEIYPESKV